MAIFNEEDIKLLKNDPMTMAMSNHPFSLIFLFCILYLYYIVKKLLEITNARFEHQIGNNKNNKKTIPILFFSFFLKMCFQMIEKSIFICNFVASNRKGVTEIRRNKQGEK